MKRFSICTLILLAIACLIYADDRAQICDHTVEFPAPPVEERILTRTFPSVVRAANPVLIEGLAAADFYANPREFLTKDEYIVIDDLHFSNFVPYEHTLTIRSDHV